MLTSATDSITMVPVNPVLRLTLDRRLTPAGRLVKADPSSSRAPGQNPTILNMWVAPTGGPARAADKAGGCGVRPWVGPEEACANRSRLRLFFDRSTYPTRCSSGFPRHSRDERTN